MRRLLPFLLASLVLQSYALSAAVTVSIAAPRNWVLAGSTVPLQAQAFNEFGTPVSDYAPAWVSQNPDIATVDAAGVVTGFKPGIAVIEADDPSGVVATVALSVYPSRIDVTPDMREMFAGDALTFSARAFDAEGKPIPDVLFRWHSDVPGIATADDNGVVRASEQGRVTLTAFIVANAVSFSSGGQTIINVRRRPDYKLTRVPLPGRGSTTIRNFTGMSVSKNDKYSYIAHLGTGAQAVVLVENNVSTTVATTGVYVPEMGAVPSQFLGTSVNSNGDVAVLISHLAEWCERSVVVFSRKGNRLVDHSFNCEYSPAARMLNDAGDVVLQKQTSAGKRVLGVFRADGSLTEVVAVGDTLTGLGRLESFQYVAGGENGSANFIASGPNGARGAYWWDGKTIRKLVVTGESWPGALRSLTDVFDVKDSAFGIFHILGRTQNNGSVLLRSDNGTISADVTTNDQVGSPTLNWIHGWLDARPSGVTFIASTSQGDGYTLKTSGFITLGLKTVANWLDEQPVFVTSKGSLWTVQPSSEGKRQIVQFDGAGRIVLASTGDTWKADAPNGQGFSIISRNMTSDAVVVRAPGDLIYTIRAGAVTGAPLSAGDTVTGSGVLNAFNSHRAGNTGNIALTASRSGGALGMYISRNGALSKVAEINQASDLTTTGKQLSWMLAWNNNDLVAVNPSDQIATWCQIDGITNLCLLDSRSRTARPVYTVRTQMADGAVLNDIWQVAIDDAGRILFLGPSAKGQLLAFWDGKTARRIAETSGSLAGAEFNSVNSMQGVGNNFYFRANFRGAFNNAIIKFDGTTTAKVLSDDNPPLSIPVSLGGFYGPDFAVNARGDLAYFGYSGSDRFVAVRKADGTDALVALSTERSAENDWFILYNSLSLSDTGVVYFTSEVWNGGQRQIALHRAVPQ